MTSEEFATAAKSGAVSFESSESGAPETESGTSEGATPGLSINQFLPLLVQLQSVQQYVATAPTYIPQTFQDQFQFVFDGTNYLLYLYFNNQWNSIKLGSSDAPGDMKMAAYASAPTGWLLCNGAAISRTTYAALFTAIGTTYGSGDGSTTFNLPDMRGKVPAGYKSGDANFGTLGGAVGEAAHALTTGEMPAHTHTVPSNNPGSFITGSGFAHGDPSNPGTAATTSSTGSGTAHNNIQPSLTINFFIKT